LFKDKEHVVFFDDATDLRQKIGYYIDHEQERERIAQAGHALVIAQHTYKHRMEKILEVSHAA
jgi:spore maturation protein CgeB